MSDSLRRAPVVGGQWSVVNDVLMPPIGLLVGGEEFGELQFVLREAATLANGEEVSLVAIRYGAFLNTICEFLIVALSVFVVVKVMNRIIRSREKEAEPPAPAE